MGKGIKTFGEHITEFYGEQITTGTGIVSTTIPPFCDEVMVNGAAATRIQLAPPIALCLKTHDSGATFTDYTSQAKDKDVATLVVLSDLPNTTNGGYWYLASKYKFGGATIALTADVNGTATSTSTGVYWNGTAWANISLTDNTASGSVTLAVDGTITWTTPAAWKRTTLNGVTGLYVVRLTSDKVMDAAVTLEGIALLPDTTNSPAGFFAATTDYVFTINPDETGAIGLYAGAGSTANVTYMRHTKRGNS